MARPSKNNADYFPHLTGMRNHRKVKVLRNKFGYVLGYAFWSLMLEWLTEHDGLEWEYNDIEIEMFASELGVSGSEIKEMVEYCITLGLLFKTESNFIYSDSLNEILQPLFDKRNKEREKSKERKRAENGKYTTSQGVSATETTTAMVIFEEDNQQSKEEKSKEEKSIEKKRNTRKIFIAPTLEEIQLYFIDKFKSSTKAADIFSNKFFNHYQSNGWKVGGKSKMVSWEASINGTWSNTAQELCEKFPIQNNQPEIKRRTLNDKYE